MSKITEVRLTLAAFIYGIEIDLKNLIKKDIIPFHLDLHFIQNHELETKVIERYNKENPQIDYKNSLEDTIDFLDFGDTFAILKKNSSFINKQASEYLNSIYEHLTDIIPIRNRVM